MQATRSTSQEAAEDVFFGQIVIIWARWFLIAAGVILALWSADSNGEISTGQISVGIIPVVALMAVNFFLHGRYLMERPANRILVTISSVVDLAMITLVVFLFPGDTSFDSPFYIGYFPVVLAFAFVMPARTTFIFTLATLAVYALAFFGATAIDDVNLTSAELKTLVIRLISIGAMGGLGTFYWRIQRDRRRAAAGVMSPPSAAPSTGA